MRENWLWALFVGLAVGAGVVIVATIRYGFSLPLVVVGAVLAAGFGGYAAIGLRRTSID